MPARSAGRASRCRCATRLAPGRWGSAWCSSISPCSRRSAWRRTLRSPSAPRRAVGGAYSRGVAALRHAAGASPAGPWAGRQRVEIVRCLMQDIRLLILDECDPARGRGSLRHPAPSCGGGLQCPLHQPQAGRGPCALPARHGAARRTGGRTVRAACSDLELARLMVGDAEGLAADPGSAARFPPGARPALAQPGPLRRSPAPASTWRCAAARSSVSPGSGGSSRCATCTGATRTPSACPSPASTWRCAAARSSAGWSGGARCWRWPRDHPPFRREGPGAGAPARPFRRQPAEVHPRPRDPPGPAPAGGGASHLGRGRRRGGADPPRADCLARCRYGDPGGLRGPRRAVPAQRPHRRAVFGSAVPGGRHRERFAAAGRRLDGRSIRGAGGGRRRRCPRSL